MYHARRHVSKVSRVEYSAFISSPDFQSSFCAHEDVVGAVVVVEAWGVGQDAVLAEDAHGVVRFGGGAEDAEDGFCARDGEVFACVGGEEVGCWCSGREVDAGEFGSLGCWFEGRRGRWHDGVVAGEGWGGCRRHVG